MGFVRSQLRMGFNRRKLLANATERFVGARNEEEISYYGGVFIDMDVCATVGAGGCAGDGVCEGG